MATLETLDILFKSSGKSDILKDIKEIEGRWGDITKNITENIQKIVELRKELGNVNDLTKESVSLVEKEAQAKQSVLQEEKKLEKTKNRGLSQQWRNEKARENAEKAREKAEKARDKANHSEKSGRIGGYSPSGKGIDWGKWGGLASVASFASSIMSKTKGAIMSSGDATLDLIMSAYEASTPQKKVSSTEMEKLFSRIVDTGLVSIPQGASILRNLSSKFRGGFFGDNGFWEAIGLSGGNIHTSDFFKIIESLEKASKSGKLTQAQMEGFSRIDPNLLPILQNMREYNQSIFPDLDKQLQTRKELQVLMSKYEQVLSKLGVASLPALKNLTAFTDGILNFNNEISKRIEENTGIKSELTNTIALLVEGAITLGVISGVKNGVKSSLKALGVASVSALSGFANFVEKYASKAVGSLAFLFTPNTAGGGWETMTPKMRESLKDTALNPYRGVTIPPIPPNAVPHTFNPSGNIIEGKDINIKLSVPENAQAGVYHTSINFKDVVTNEILTSY